MKRRLALSIVGSIASAHSWAQSSVTVYGALDAYVAQQTASGSAHRRVLNSGFSPNVLGFSGTEDLGEGLKAGFVLEGQPALDTGTYGQGGKVFGRQSNVFLGGNWGRVALGRLHTAGRAFGVKYSASGWLTSDPIGNLEVSIGSSVSFAMNSDSTGSRLNNAISYSSPTLGGVSFSLMQSAAEGGPFSAGQAKMSALGVSYATGPFSADLVYNVIPSISRSQLKQTDFALGGTYDAGLAKFFAAFQAKRGFGVTAAAPLVAVNGSEATDRLISVGAQIPVGAGTVGVAVGRSRIADAHKGLRAANYGPPFNGVMDDVSAWGLTYTHYLSKRTQLFAAYGGLSNSGLGTASITPDLRPVGGGKSSVLASGIRHSF